MNPRTRRTALYAIGAIAILASANALAHSYAGLYDWAVHHRLGGWQAMSWPAEIDVFLAVGELALYVAYLDGWPQGFLSFGALTELELGPGLTVVVGPNGVGKSNLGRCLDLTRAVIGRAAGDPAAERLDLYKDAGYEGAGSFEVRLSLFLDQPWERDLVRDFVCSAFVTPHELRDKPNSPSSVELDTLARTAIPEASLEPLWSGSLVIRYDSALSMPWFAAWEFEHAGRSWHVALYGQGSYGLESRHRGGPISAGLCSAGAAHGRPGPPGRDRRGGRFRVDLRERVVEVARGWSSLVLGRSGADLDGAW